MKRIEKIVSEGLCQGCGACSAAVGGNSITIKLNAEGYMRPRLVEGLPPEKEKLAVAACSGVALEHAAGDPRHFDGLWGPLMSVHAGYAADDEIRFAGSSGGVVSALATY